MIAHPDLSFGTRLKRHRAAAGLSQEELAERAGLGVRTISNLERGVSRWPYAGTVALLAEALGLDEEARAALEAAARRLPDAGVDDAAALVASAASVGTPSLPGYLTALIGRECDEAA